MCLILVPKLQVIRYIWIIIINHKNIWGDENLSFDLHIQKISNRISGSLGTLNRLKRMLPQNTLLLLYNSLILPHLQYAILCWGKKTSRLFILQKKAVRNIVCSKYKAHTDPIFKKLKLLKLDDIYNMCLLKFYYKLEHENLPVYFRNFMTSHNHTHTHLRSRSVPVPTYTRTKSAQLSVRNYLPTFLCQFPNLIIDKVDTHSYEGFSRYCKNYFINSYGNPCIIENCYICLNDDWLQL